MEADIDTLALEIGEHVVTCKKLGMEQDEIHLLLYAGVSLCGSHYEKGSIEYVNCATSILLTWEARFSCAKAMIDLADMGYKMRKRLPVGPHELEDLRWLFDVYREAGLTNEDMDEMWNAAQRLATPNYFPDSSRRSLVAHAGTGNYDQLISSWTPLYRATE